MGSELSAFYPVAKPSGLDNKYIDLHLPTLLGHLELGGRGVRRHKLLLPNFSLVYGAHWPLVLASLKPSHSPCMYRGPGKDDVKGSVLVLF